MLLSEDDPGSVISLLIDQQEQTLREEMNVSQKKLKKIHLTMLLTGIPFTILQWGSIILWIMTGIWWPFLIYVLVVIPYAIWVSRYYFKHVAYICPQCHEIFRPSFKEALWARHTPSTRKLTCTCCGHHGFCVETYGGDVK